MKVASLGHKNMQAYFVYLSTFATFIQNMKVASLGHKNMQAYFVYLSTFATFVGDLPEKRELETMNYNLLINDLLQK